MLHWFDAFTCTSLEGPGTRRRGLRNGSLSACSGDHWLEALSFLQLTWQKRVPDLRRAAFCSLASAAAPSDSGSTHLGSSASACAHGSPISARSCAPTRARSWQSLRRTPGQTSAARLTRHDCRGPSYTWPSLDALSHSSCSADSGAAPLAAGTASSSACSGP